MKSVVSVSNLSKRYTLGSETITGQSFREMLLNSLISPIKKIKRLKGTDVNQTSFWALKNIDFDVYSGEIVGIIGRNGAGKSTLLKILSRITSPTMGEIKYHGRMASLLEVGTGFHPELTGRENIFLNGTILGLTRKEITEKMRDIVDFAEISDFLDTPVKRYSSGMYVRLAFSVAAHLEADILIIDEILAVGDSAFQKKCLGKIKNIANNGRTVFFVSHNMAAVASLCTRGIWLDNGQIKLDGSIRSVLDAYDRPHTKTEDQATTEILSNKSISITSVTISGQTNDTHHQLYSNSACVIKLSGKNFIPLSRAQVTIGIYDDTGTRLSLLKSNHTGYELNRKQGKFQSYCKIKKLNLASGRYTINIAIIQNSELIIGTINSS